MNESLEQRLKTQARQLGFELVAIAEASDADHFDHYREWLDQGFAGEMHYLHKNAEPRRHPQSMLADVKSVLMLGITYSHAPQVASNTARIAAYAQHDDYHEVLWEKLDQLAAWLMQEVPSAHCRGVVDTAPLLERDFARRAGLGWIGKNTMLISKTHGSFFLIGALLTSLELAADPPHTASHCGTCTACLDACPTDAFPKAGWLDARRCISYLTIELKGAIPNELRPGVGDWLFGCDICQDVCPWNRKPLPQTGLIAREDLIAIDPRELLSLSPTELRQRFKGTSLRRANWRGLLRNAAIVIGNRGDRNDLEILRKALEWKDEVVSDACQWAIEEIED